MPHDLQHAVVQPQVLGRTAAGNHQGVVVGRIDGVEIGREREVVARLFAVGLIALEVVDGGAHRFARPLAGTHRIDAMPDHQQHLERDHRLVVLDEIADQHQDSFAAMICLLIKK